MHKKIIAVTSNELESVTGKSPVVVALTEDGELYMRRLTTHTRGWRNISITENDIITNDDENEGE